MTSDAVVSCNNLDVYNNNNNNNNNGDSGTFTGWAGMSPQKCVL